MKRISATILLLWASAALAQFDLGNGESPYPPTTPDTVMPAGKIFIDTSTIPPKRTARVEVRAEVRCHGTYDTTCPNDNQSAPNRLIGTPGGTGFANHNGGSFRVQCGLSHASFDDPIVWPGQAGRTHLHGFFGNDSTRAASDLANMATAGKSTCTGGTLNRTGYWTPIWVYHCPAATAVADGCDADRDGEVQWPADSNAIRANFYYKIAADYHSTSSSFGGGPAQWWPPGFRMISGNTNYLITTPQNGGKFQIHCSGNGGGAGFDHLPTQAEVDAAIPGAAGQSCDDIKLRVGFAQCWDGVNIDWPVTHQGHVTEIAATHDATCPSAFPISTPEITVNMHTVIAYADLPFVRLSSDMPRAEAKLNANCHSTDNWCAGRTMHADWVNGWSAVPNGSVTAPYAWNGLTVTELILKGCYMIDNPESAPVHSDCHDNMLAAPFETGIGNGTSQGDLDWWVLY